MYTFNHAFFSGRPLSHRFPLCFLLMGIGLSFLVCTIWPFLVRNDYLLWEYYYVSYFRIRTFWPFLLRNSDRVRQAKLISSFFPSIISHGEIFFYDNYIWLLYEKTCLLYLWPKLVYQLTVILGNTIYFTIITQLFYMRNLGLVLVSPIGYVSKSEKWF